MSNEFHKLNQQTYYRGPTYFQELSIGPNATIILSHTPAVQILHFFKAESKYSRG